MSVADLTSDPQALNFLDEASGELAAACLTAQLYTDADLAEIATVAGPSQAYMKRIVGRIALRNAMENRPEKYGKQLEALREICDGVLEQLRGGKRLFVVPSRPNWQAEGGTPECSGHEHDGHFEPQQPPHPHAQLLPQHGPAAALEPARLLTGKVRKSEKWQVASAWPASHSPLPTPHFPPPTSHSQP